MLHFPLLLPLAVFSAGPGCVWLGSRGSDGKKLLSLAGMLGDILWGAVAPLVYCGCISVAPECSIVFCSGLDDE